MLTTNLMSVLVRVVIGTYYLRQTNPSGLVCYPNLDGMFHIWGVLGTLLYYYIHRRTHHITSS